MTIQEIKFLLKKYGIKPRKAQGQNFLLKEEVAKIAVEAAGITTEDTVLEIGAGFGILTAILAEHASRVTAVEQDRQIFPALLKLVKNYPSISPICSDTRLLNLKDIGLESKKYKIVANLPYSISLWTVRNFLEFEPKPKNMVLMLQKEVGQRLVARPPQMSVLSVVAQYFSEVEIVRYVSRYSFYPVPDVDSVLVSFILKEPGIQEPKEFLRLVKIGFAAKRKQLHNNLSAGLKISATEVSEALKKVSLSSKIRPQELSLEDWGKLYCVLKRNMVK